MGETYLSHLKSRFFCSLFRSDFSGDYSFTSCMKEYMAEYFDAYHIPLEQNYRTWDPHLCHWIIFYWSLEACMHLENDGLLTWRYKNFHDFLMRHLIDVHFYYVFMCINDIYYVLMMFGRMHTRKWDPVILFPHGMGWRALLIVGVQYKQWDPGIFFVPLIFNFFWETISRGDEFPN